jgi:hypothetical protein
VYLSAREALLSVKGVLRRLGDRKALGSFYVGFSRRFEVPSSSRGVIGAARA